MPRTIETPLWVVLILLTVVLPNAFKEVSSVILVLLGIYYAFSSYRRSINGTFMTLWTVSCVVTITYLIVGRLNGAPDEAMFQIPVIYIASPLLWAFAIHGALLRYGLEAIIKALNLATFLAIISQAFYFWAFSTFGPQAVEFMVSNPNVNLGDNSAAAVMHVFGSMIFLYAGVMASPHVIEKKWMRYGLIILVLASAFTSGRNALIIALVVGASLNALLTLSAGRRGIENLATNIVFAVSGLMVVSYALSFIYEIDIFRSLSEVVEKISTGGGAQRQDYLPLLLYGSMNDSFMGAGHGIGVRYVASEEFPWRYEMVWIATLYRVGAIGALVYALPFIISIWKSISAWRANSLSDQEKYLAGALISAFLSTNTNPYIEAYVFQWMYVLPCLYFTQTTFSRKTRVEG